ncbi:MAG: hypothetical protein MR210_00015 [Erysipelotrichaceae bacterium]|nr:hypothetical protein [Erysipelotrichaceae bacterium]
MIKALTIEGDLAKALTLKMRLIKKDKLHNYQKSLLIFDTLYNLDCDQHQKNIDLLQANQRFFQGSLDYLLIRNYTYFISYYYLNNRSLLKTYYDKLLHLKDAKIKGQKVSPLYNWDLLEAIYQLALKNYRKSHTFFKNTDTTNLNNRELALYHLEYGRCLCKLQRYAQAKKQLQKCCETANTAIYKQKALDLLKQLTA